MLLSGYSHKPELRCQTTVIAAQHRMQRDRLDRGDLPDQERQHHFPGLLNQYPFQPAADADRWAAVQQASSPFKPEAVLHQVILSHTLHCGEQQLSLKPVMTPDEQAT
jgi:hypothetical protein